MWILGASVLNNVLTIRLAFLDGIGIANPLLSTDRVDPMDRGAEYRSLLGLPGGTGHPSYPAVEEAAQKYGFKLLAGKGNDPDTLGKQTVYVYDTKQFPFYQAEVYHQVSLSL
jgi:hypothetical protein